MVFVAALFGSGVLGVLQGGRAGGDVVWAADYDTALAEARRTKRPLLLSFSAPGCGWCRKMDAETFSDPDVVATAQDFVCVRLDSAVDAEVFRRYTVFGTPETIITDSEGHAKGRLPGYIAPDRFGPALRSLRKEIARR